MALFLIWAVFNRVSMTYMNAEIYMTRPGSAVGNMSGCRYLSDCSPGVASSIRARSHIFVEIDHEMISTVILLPSADSRRVVVSYKHRYVHEVLVNCLVKLAQEKSVARRTDYPDMTIAVD